MTETQNTYQLQPREDQKFYPSKVKTIIESTINETCSTLVYNPERATQICEEISKDIRQKIKKQLFMPRYKLGFQVMLGENKGQGIRIASKSLWDKNFDNYASYTLTNQRIFCTAIIFGAYCQ